MLDVVDDIIVVDVDGDIMVMDVDDNIIVMDVDDDIIVIDVDDIIVMDVDDDIIVNSNPALTTILLSPPLHQIANDADVLLPLFRGTLMAHQKRGAAVAGRPFSCLSTRNTCTHHTYTRT